MLTGNKKDRQTPISYKGGYGKFVEILQNLLLTALLLILLSNDHKKGGSVTELGNLTCFKLVDITEMYVLITIVSPEDVHVLSQRN